MTVSPIAPITPIISTPTQQDLSQNVSEENQKKRTIIEFCKRSDRFSVTDHHTYDTRFKELSAKGKIEVLDEIYDNRDQFIHFKDQLPSEMRDKYEAILAGLNVKEDSKKEIGEMGEKHYIVFIPYYASERFALTEYIRQLK